MAKVAKKTMTYRELLSQTSEDLKAEQLDNQVELGEICFRQGLSDIEIKLLSAKSRMSSAEMQVKNGEGNLTIAKKSSANILVQNIVNAKLNLDQAHLNLEAETKAYNKLLKLQEYLVEVQGELFG